MFSNFENMIKDKIDSIKKQLKAPSISTPSITLTSSSNDLSKTAQRYTIQGRQIQQLKLLSEGSFGFIWLAEDISTKQKFALKRIVCITKERYQLAKQELDLMMKFPKHKNLVGCFGGELITLKNSSSSDSNNSLKVLVILMEYCPNGNLFTMLESRQNKGFSQAQLLHILKSILQGLRQINKCQIYHQDIKLQNVLVGQDKSLKICDFGSCSNRFINFSQIPKAEYETIKEEIENVTTPMYRPPEIVDPYKGYQVGKKVDVWMVGCILYTLVYFTHPFVDSNAVGIVNGVVRYPKYPKQTKYKSSQKINDLIRHLLTPNPKYRPSVQECLSIVQNYQNLPQIKLNPQAQRIKQEYLQKQKSMELINSNLGDVQNELSEDRIRELQERIRNRMKLEQGKTSFIPTNQKNIISANNNKNFTNNTNVNQGNGNNFKSNPGNSFQNMFSFDKKPEKTQNNQQQQKTVDFDSFWNPQASSSNQTKNTSNMSTNNTKIANQFDQFANFFTNDPINNNKNQSNQTKKAEIQSSNTNKAAKTQNNQQNDIFSYFTQQEKQQRPSNKGKISQNLLDL